MKANLEFNTQITVNHHQKERCMKYIKKIICGDRELEISQNTTAIIRLATDKERRAFIKRHWHCPEDLPCQNNMWESLCEMLNTLENSIPKISMFDINGKKIWRECLKALNIDDSSLYKCHFKFVPADDTDTEPTIRIESTYAHLVAQTDEWGNEITNSNGNTQYETTYTSRTILCNYPQDFCTILNIIEQYFPKEMNYKKLSELDQLHCVVFEIATEKKLRAKNRQNKLKIFTFIRLYCYSIISFKEYAFAWSQITEQENYKKFYKSSQRVLDVDGEIFFEFENDCGFDIDKKEIELNGTPENAEPKMIGIIEKVKSTNNNLGEINVEYHIEWFRDTYKDKWYIVPIERNCEGRYTYNCIWLRKSDFREEHQEYDHIVVCPAGVVWIETKNWKGILEIRSDGQWIRKDDKESAGKGAQKTKSQMTRHQNLMQKIFPDIAVHSLLCFSHDEIIINGRENCNDFTIITVDELEKTLFNLCSSGTYSKQTINDMVAVIEDCKDNFQNDCMKNID